MQGQKFRSPGTAKIGQVVGKVRIGTAVAPARYFAQFLGAQEGDQRVQHADGEFEVGRKIDQPYLPAHKKHFGDKFDQEKKGQASFLRRARRVAGGQRPIRD
ncbi:hypothetical protein LP415_14900 [Polaromonas sp. P1(28)-8]|nr:hypothetical protein LP415_14900 [Polaromonas sp. P1(28)-8]